MGGVTTATVEALLLVKRQLHRVPSHRCSVEEVLSSEVTQTNPFLNLFFRIIDWTFLIKKLNGKHKYSNAVLCVRAAASSRTSDRLSPVECLRAKVGVRVKIKTSSRQICINTNT